MPTPTNALTSEANSSILDWPEKDRPEIIIKPTLKRHATKTTKNIHSPLGDHPEAAFLTLFAQMRTLCNATDHLARFLYRETTGEAYDLKYVWFGMVCHTSRRDKCVERRLRRLGQMGHELRRPEADLLRNGVYELRVGLHGVNYRMLYFLHGNIAATASHGLNLWNAEVPPVEIDRKQFARMKHDENPSPFDGDEADEKWPAIAEKTNDGLEIIHRFFYAGRSLKPICWQCFRKRL